jgi:dipeptidyl aminopeptidase/acylaminoacyl peptidase
VRFTLIGSPRFSPDGRQLVVPLAQPPSQAREASPQAPWGLLAVPIAQAHGNPSEIYLIDVDGGQPKRLTTLTEDEPAVSWSPDGVTMAVYATRGLYLIDRQGKTTLATEAGGYGGLDWGP